MPRTPEEVSSGEHAGCGEAMIIGRDKDGKPIAIASLECSAADVRKLTAALTASGSTSPYRTVKLPRGSGVTSVLVVTEKAAAPKPKHQAAFPDSDLGNPELKQ